MSRVNFGSGDFQPDDYVSGLCDSADITLAHIQKYKARLNLDVESNNVALRANVNKNYANFIETAKETSKLEADMFELSNLLNEQSTIMRGLNLAVASATQTQRAAEPEPDRFALADVQGLERVGLNPLAAADCVMSGPVTLLDPDTFATKAKKHLFLLTKMLIIARPNKPGRTPPLLFEDLVNLSELTVADPADADSGSGRILLQAEERAWLVAAPTPADKRAWLLALRRTLGKLRGAKGDTAAPQHTWLDDAPEDIEVCIAQRAFANAVDLVERAQEELQAGGPRLDSVPARIEACARRLAAALVTEMARPALRRHAIRATVQLLLRLDEHEKACRAYLDSWAATIQRESRRLKMEGSTELYVFKLSQMFFGLLRSTCHEFSYLFDNSSKSAYVRWAQQQLAGYAAVLARQVLDSTAASLATVADCMATARTSCAALLEDGLDLQFALDALVQDGIVHAIEEAGRSWISATAHHLTDETWEPRRLGSRAQQQAFKEQMAAYGIAHVDDYIDGGKCLLFESTTQFCIETREFFTSAALLLDLQTMGPILEWTNNVFLLFLSKISQKYDGRPIFHTNAAFVLDFVFPAARAAFEKRHGGTIPSLAQLASDLTRTWAEAASEEGITHI